MSIQRHSCYTVSCDECRTVFDETADYVVHFDTEDEAIRYIVECGWVLTETGSPICQRCHVTTECRQHGHQHSDWTPCACHGSIPDHALFGCGLFRICWRDGCDHYETRTLAQLPTTDEPSIGC